MGAVHLENTHVRRSSSMTFALLYKRENLRLIGWIAGIIAAAVLMFTALYYGTMVKNVSLIVNGKYVSVQTSQLDLQHLLKQQGINVNDHDRISKPLATALINGDTITIDHTTPVQLKVDGQTKTVYSTGKTVSGVLQDLNITMGANDKVSPALDNVVNDYASIQIVRVTKNIEEQEHQIPFETIKSSEPKLLKGKVSTVQEGKPGLSIARVEKVYEDGQLVSEKVLNESIRSQSVNKIVALGTKNPVTISGESNSVTQVIKSDLNFGAKQILRNVTLTAYAADRASTGKSNGDPQFGITFTGTRVTEGRTIAVDPKVIPLGWWVYIDGIGFRRAEDIGSGVRGKSIDVFFNNADYVNRFGLKHGFTVYIIGPVKPSAN